MRFTSVVMLLTAATLAAGVVNAETPISHIVVVGATGTDATDQEQARLALAASELADYLGTMADRPVDIIEPTAETKANTLLVVGNAEQNALAADLVEQGIVDLTLPTDHRDAFVVRYGTDGERDYLVFAGANGLGTLYAVYHYLEKCCYVGSFMDGEHVPSRKRVPVEDVDIVESPRLRDRYFGFSACYGIKKFFSQFLSASEINVLTDWLVKRKMNRTGWGFNAYPGGMEAVNAFDYECRPEEDYGAGWPRGWTYAPEYRTKMLQDWFAYGRERGVQYVYGFNFGLVPKPYRDKHPDLPYMGNLGYGADCLDPDSPECVEVMGKYVHEIERLYGTDHIYQCTPYVESSGANTPEESFEIKLEAAKQMCAVFEQIDPDYIWQSDSWDFGAVPNVWTPERIATYFGELTPLHSRMYMYDTASDFWYRTNFFGGINWAYGVLHSFQGDDHLHGDLAAVNSQIKKAANDPGSTRLMGLYHIPESFGHNILYFQMTSAMSWDPNEIDVEDFLEEYCRTRYNAKSYDTMMDCTHNVVDAVYSGGGMDMYYQRMGIGYNPGISPPFDDYPAFQRHYLEAASEVRLMEAAVTYALRAAKSERGNKLYENDMVDYTKTMLGLKSNYYTIEAYKAFKAGDSEAFEEAASNSMKCLDGIETILSTRPDYSLQKTIDEVMAVPGTNPFVPRMIRKHAINDLYAPVDNYEQLVLYYKPRMAAYYDAMRTRLAAGETSFLRGNMDAVFGQLDQQWWDNECRVPEDKRFKGTTMEAIKSVYDCVPLGVIQKADRVELKADQVLECTPDVPSSLQAIGWEDGPITVAEQDGKRVWRFGDGIGTYLYFTVDPKVAINTKEPAVIAVDYLDSGTGRLELHYDSEENAYMGVLLATLSDSGEWERVELTVPDISFGKQQNGASDFRLCMSGGTVAVAQVVVASPHVTALPVFGVVAGE